MAEEKRGAYNGMTYEQIKNKLDDKFRGKTATERLRYLSRFLDEDRNIGSSRGYRKLRRNTLDNLERYAKEIKEKFLPKDDVIRGIHKYAPKYIFLTESSSTVIGYQIKEALRHAYPGEPLPKFYRIDPKQVMPLMFEAQQKMHGKEVVDESFEQRKRALEEFFKRRIKDKNARILVYDMDWASGQSPGSIVQLLKNPERYGFDPSIKHSEVKMNTGEEGHTVPTNEALPYKYGILQLPDIGEEDVLPFIGGWGGGVKFRVTPKAGQALDEDIGGNYNFQGRRPRSSKGRKKALEYIRELKEQGKFRGEKIRKQDLEGKVTGIVAIAGLGAGLLFLSTNITGNAIADLSFKTTSFLGVGLLIVGLVAGFFWMRSRR